MFYPFIYSVFPILVANANALTILGYLTITEFDILSYSILSLKIKDPNLLRDILSCRSLCSIPSTMCNAAFALADLRRPPFVPQKHHLN